ncbi:unnamed protein product, partial [Ectocarpus sp. 12 AP-2014]
RGPLCPSSLGTPKLRWSCRCGWRKARRFKGSSSCRTRLCRWTSPPRSCTREVSPRLRTSKAATRKRSLGDPRRWSFSGERSTNCGNSKTRR